MIRRRLTIKRLDPWSVLKFGAVANVVLFAVLMLVAGIVWYIIDQLQLVDQACGIATDVGFTSCGINAGNLFRALALLGGMGVIVQTAVLVFGAFLYNLISDLTGGLSITTVEEGTPSPSVASSTRPATATSSARPATTASPPATTTRHDPEPARRRPDATHERPRSTAGDRDATGVHQPGQTVGPRRRGDGEELFTER